MGFYPTLYIMKPSTKNIVAIGVGSNIDPESNILQAKQILACDHRLLAESDFVKTKPIGLREQPDYTNGAWLIETSLVLDALKRYLKNVETACGRERSPNKYGPREIDLDIVVWNGKIIDPDYFDRDFLETAINQLLPNLTPDP